MDVQSALGKEMATVMISTTMQDATMMVGIAVETIRTQHIALIANALPVLMSPGWAITTAMMATTMLVVTMMVEIAVDISPIPGVQNASALTLTWPVALDVQSAVGREMATVMMATTMKDATMMVGIAVE